MGVFLLDMVDRGMVAELVGNKSIDMLFLQKTHCMNGNIIDLEIS